MFLQTIAHLLPLLMMFKLTISVCQLVDSCPEVAEVLQVEILGHIVCG